MKKLLILLLVCWSLGIGINAQEEQFQTSEQVEVLLRDIRIHVLDSRGRPVKGLTLNDFQVEEDGVARPLSFFENVNLSGIDEDQGVTQSDSPETAFQISHAKEPRYILILLDSGNMTKSVFKKAVEALHAFIETDLDDGVFVKIIQLDEGMNHLIPFTTDRNEMLAGLEKAKYRGFLQSRIFSLERDIVDNIIKYAEVARREAQLLNQQRLEPEGMQVMFQNRVNALVEEKGRLKGDYYHTFYLNMVALARSLRPLLGSKSIFLLSGGNYLEPNPAHIDTMAMAKKMTRILNSVNATVYTYLKKPNQSVAEKMLQSAANRRPLDFIGGDVYNISSLQNSAIFPPSESNSSISFNSVLENDRQLETGPAQVADETGGLFVSSTSTKGFRNYLEDFYDKSGRYYRLGYTVFSSEIKPKPSLAVTVRGGKENGWKVIYGKRLERLTPYQELDEEDRRLEFEALLLFSHTSRNDLGCDFGYELFPERVQGYRIPVFAHLPVFGKLDKGYEVGFAALGAQYEVLDITRSEMAKAQAGSQLMLYDVLVTDYLPKYLRYYIRNATDGGLSFHEIVLDEFGTPKPANHITNIMLTVKEPSQLVAFNHYRQSEQEVDRVRKDKDPLTLGDTMFRPHVDDEFQKPEWVGFFFHIYQVPNPSETYQIDVKLESGGESKKIDVQISKVFSPETGTHHFYGKFDAHELAVGLYKLHIKVTNPKDGDVFERTKQFSIAP